MSRPCIVPGITRHLFQDSDQIHHPLQQWELTMMKDQTLANRHRCDEDGFSLPEVAWNEDLATTMATEDHLPGLSDCFASAEM